MSNVVFLREVQAVIPTIPIVDGQVLFETDQGNDGKIYLDDGVTRIQIGGSNIVDTALSTTSNNPVQNKVITLRINDIDSEQNILQGEEVIISNLGWVASTTVPSYGFEITVLTSYSHVYPKFYVFNNGLLTLAQIVIRNSLYGEALYNNVTNQFTLYATEIPSEVFNIVVK